MKVFQCDCCKKVIEDPYEVNFREYFVLKEFTSNGDPYPNIKKEERTAELCKNCYDSFNLIKENTASSDVFDNFVELLKSRHKHSFLGREYIGILVSDFDNLVKLFRGIK